MVLVKVVIEHANVDRQGKFFALYGIEPSFRWPEALFVAEGDEFVESYIFGSLFDFFILLLEMLFMLLCDNLYGMVIIIRRTTGSDQTLNATWRSTTGQITTWCSTAEKITSWCRSIRTIARRAPTRRNTRIKITRCLSWYDLLAVLFIVRSFQTIDSVRLKI